MKRSNLEAEASPGHNDAQITTCSTEWPSWPSTNQGTNLQMSILQLCQMLPYQNIAAIRTNVPQILSRKVNPWWVKQWKVVNWGIILGSFANILETSNLHEACLEAPSLNDGFQCFECYESLQTLHKPLQPWEGSHWTAYRRPAQKRDQNWLDTSWPNLALCRFAQEGRIRYCLPSHAKPLLQSPSVALWGGLLRQLK